MAKFCALKCLIIAQIFMIFSAVFVNTENVAAPTLRTADTVYLIWNQEKLTWHRALEFCKARNMSLLSFDSQDTLVKVNTFLMKNDFIDRTHIGNDYIYWTGGNDLQREGTFVWESTGAPFTYSNWLPGMPDNWRGDEHCVEMGFRVLGRWNDNRCWYRRHFICQRAVAAHGATTL